MIFLIIQHTLILFIFYFYYLTAKRYLVNHLHEQGELFLPDLLRLLARLLLLYDMVDRLEDLQAVQEVVVVVVVDTEVVVVALLVSHVLHGIVAGGVWSNPIL